MKRFLMIFLLFAAVITVFTGCGGSGSSPVVVTYNSDVDGIVFSSGILNTDGTQMGVGDNITDTTLQSLISYTRSLPAGATITNAVLRLYHCESSNVHLGNVLVEHLHVDFGAIDATDFAGTPGGLTHCGEFTSLPIGWVELNVTTSVQEDQAAARSKSQFRLYRISLTDSDGTWDSDSFYTLEDPTHKPELVITYTL